MKRCFTLSRTEALSSSGTILVSYLEHPFQGGLEKVLICGGYSYVILILAADWAEFFTLRIFSMITYLISAMGWILSLLFFYKDGFGFK